MIRDCPKKIDGATVLGFAVLDAQNQATKRTTQIVAGEIKGMASAMILAQYEGDSGFYLFGCYAEDWSVDTDTYHDTIDEALAQMDWEYQGLSKNMVWYKEHAQNT